MIKSQATQDVLTIQEVAEYLRVSEATVRRYASRFAIPGRQIGNQWRFSRTAVDEWLRSASGKEILLSQAGAFRDDPDDLAALREAIYKERGRPEVDELD